MSVKDTVKNAAEAVKEKAEQAACWVKEKTGMGSCDASNVKPHMDVISSCGCTMGKVDGVQGDQIKLTKNDSPDGQHHYIPTAWVERVDSHVHLNKNSEECKSGWTGSAASA